jgi:hypothetical protein
MHRWTVGPPDTEDRFTAALARRSAAVIGNVSPEIELISPSIQSGRWESRPLPQPATTRQPALDPEPSNTVKHLAPTPHFRCIEEMYQKAM